MREETRYLTVQQAAERLQASDEMVRRMLRDGRLAGKRLGGKRAGWRVASDEIERLLAPDPRPRPGPRPARLLPPDAAPRRSAAGAEPAGLAPLLEKADRCRTLGDLAGAARWERHADELLSGRDARADAGSVE